MATQNVVVSRSGTGFTINVAACDLLEELDVRDFFILHNGTPYSQLSDYVKTSQTVLTYTGASLPVTNIEVRRKTPVSIIRAISFGERMSSDLWNKELDRKTRWQEEADLNGVGVAFSGSLPVPQNAAFSTTWDGDVIFPPTRNAVYDEMILRAPLNNPTFTGTPLTPDLNFIASPGGAIPNKRYVDDRDNLKANIASPAFSGTPTAPTPANGTNNTQLATTAFIVNALLNSPALGGTPTAATAATSVNNTQLATTAFARSLWTLSGSNLTYVPLNLRITWGSAVVTANVNGDATVPFGFTFASLQSVIIVDGDSNVYGRTVCVNSTSYGTGATGFNVRVSNGGSAATGTVRINYVAFGTV